MSDARQLHFNAFLFGCGHHGAAWRHPSSQVERLSDIAYYEELAQTAERGCLDAVFFADGIRCATPRPGACGSSNRSPRCPRWHGQPSGSVS